MRNIPRGSTSPAGAAMLAGLGEIAPATIITNARPTPRLTIQVRTAPRGSAQSHAPLWMLSK